LWYYLIAKLNHKINFLWTKYLLIFITVSLKHSHENKNQAAVTYGTGSSPVLISPVVSRFYTDDWHLASKRSKGEKDHISFFLQPLFPVSTKIFDFLSICLFFFLSPTSLQPPDQQRHQDHSFPEKNGKKEDLILRKKSRKCFPSNLFTRDYSMFGWFSSSHFLVCPVIS